MINKLLPLLFCLLLVRSPANCAIGSDYTTTQSRAGFQLKQTYVPDYLNTYSGCNATAADTKCDCINGITLYAQSCGGDEAQRLAKEDVYIGSDSAGNYINLEKGNVLLIPDKNMVVGTNLGKINVVAQANLFLVKSEDGLVIYDLSQTQPKQIIIMVNQKKIALTPGCMLVLTREKTKDFEHLKINCHTVAYSNVKEVDLCRDTVKAFIANFSITAAMTAICPLMRLIQSHSQQDKLVMDRLMKTAVILGDRMDPAKTVRDFNNSVKYSGKGQQLSTSL